MNLLDDDQQKEPNTTPVPTTTHHRANTDPAAGPGESALQKSDSKMTWHSHEFLTILPLPSTLFQFNATQGSPTNISGTPYTYEKPTAPDCRLPKGEAGVLISEALCDQFLTFTNPHAFRNHFRSIFDCPSSKLRKQGER